MTARILCTRRTSQSLRLWRPSTWRQEEVEEHLRNCKEAGCPDGQDNPIQDWLQELQRMAASILDNLHSPNSQRILSEDTVALSTWMPCLTQCRPGHTTTTRVQGSHKFL